MYSDFVIHTLFTTATIAVATSLLGIVVAKTMRKSDYFLSFFIAAGAGLLVGVTLTEFLPQVFGLHDHGDHHGEPHKSFVMLPSILILFGVFFVVILERYVARLLERQQHKTKNQDHHHHHDGHAHDGNPGVSSDSGSDGGGHGHNHEFCVHSHSHAHDKHISLQTACLSVGCVTVCSFFDGLEISTAFYIGAKTGWLTSVGFLLHSISNGALAASLGLAGGFSSRRAIQISVIIGGLLFLGSVVGVIGISLLDFKTYILPFSTGVMLYIAFTHLIPLALKDRIGWIGFVIGSALSFFSHYLHVH